MEESDVLIAIAEISVALVGFTGIIAAFRQPNISSWPPHIAYRFRFMCWNAFSSMAFALFPFVIHYATDRAELTWQISSVLYAACGLLLVWRTYFSARRLPVDSRSSLSSGWMMTYQLGTAVSVALLLANSASLFGKPGPSLYLLGLGMQLFIASSLFVRLLITPTQTTE